MLSDSLLAMARDRACLLNCRITLTIPAIIGWHEPFKLSISVTDATGLPTNPYSISLRLSGTLPIQGLPEYCHLAPGQYQQEITGLQVEAGNSLSIRAEVNCSGSSKKDAAIFSNPAWLFAEPSYRLYFGDLHVHSELSNCSAWRCLPPEWCYQYAQQISRLDFLAVTDHLRGIKAQAERWKQLQECVRRYDQPGEFVPFLAFESSHALGFGGDNNVYFLDTDADHFWQERADLWHIAPQLPLTELWEQLAAAGKSFFTVSHHTGRMNKYRHWAEDYYDPQHETLFEIYSNWGSSESRFSRLPIRGGNNDAAAYFEDAIAAGARFGVIASSDDHSSLPGSVHNFLGQPFEPPWNMGHAHKGLAVVKSDRLTRPALFQALRQRQCYATTGARILLQLQLAEAEMGDELLADAALCRRRLIKATCSLHNASYASAILLRNGKEIARQQNSQPASPGSILNFQFVDEQPLAQVACRNARYHPEPFVCYYLRIEDNFGNHCWSSPIWLDLKA